MLSVYRTRKSTKFHCTRAKVAAETLNCMKTTNNTNPTASIFHAMKSTDTKLHFTTTETKNFLKHLISYQRNTNSIMLEWKLMN